MTSFAHMGFFPDNLINFLFGIKLGCTQKEMRACFVTPLPTYLPTDAPIQYLKAYFPQEFFCNLKQVERNQG